MCWGTVAFLVLVARFGIILHSRARHADFRLTGGANDADAIGRLSAFPNPSLFPAAPLPLQRNVR